MSDYSVCRHCFHSYVCEQFNENRDSNNKKCLFFNDHFVPTADVAPKREVALEAICDFQLGLRRIFVNMCDGNDYNNLNLLQIDTAIDAFYEHFVEELEKNTRRTENENT